MFSPSKWHVSVTAKALTVALVLSLLTSLPAAPALAAATRPTPVATIGTIANGESVPNTKPVPGKGEIPTSPQQDFALSNSPTQVAATKLGNSPTLSPKSSFGTSTDLPAAVGFTPGKSVELTDKRTAKSTVFANPDGTETSEFFTSPVHVKDSSGKWQNIDTSLTPIGNRVSNKRALVGIDFSQTAQDPSLEKITFQDGTSVQFSLANAAAARVQVDGKVATYSSAFGGVDFKYTSQESGVAEDLILHSKNAPDTFTFPLTLKGLNAQIETSSGDVVFLNASGAISGRMTHGWMEDANKNPQTNQGALSDGIRYTLTKASNGGMAVVMHLDRTWLSDPARVFPVNVDPTTVDQNAVADDTFVMSGFTANSAGLPTMKVGTYDGGAHVGAAYVKFDVSSLAGTRVLGTRYAAYNSFSASCAARGLGVYPVTQGWNGTTMTGWPGAAYDANNRLMWAAFAMGYNSSCPAGWAYWDNSINGLVQGWANGTTPNFGLTLRVDPGSQTDNAAYKYFNSSESGGQKLTVTYSPYNATYNPAGSFSTTPTNNMPGVLPVTVTNTGTVCWPANGITRLSYHLYDAAGNLISFGHARTDLPTQVCPSQQILLNATVDALPPGNYILAWDMVNEGVSWFSEGEQVSPQNVAVSIPNVPPQFSAIGPPNGTVATTSTTTLSASASDPDSWPGAGVVYDFKICSDPAMSSGCTDSGTTGSLWTPPALFWNQPYYWQVRASDNNVWSPWTSASNLVARVAQPPLASHFGADAYSTSVNGVNPIVGNYIAPTTDAAEIGAGPAVAINRNYNSLDTSVSAFGTGWAFNYGTRLTAESGGTLLAVLPDGRQARIGINPDGSYASPAGYPMTIVAQSGNYKLIDKSGTSYLYASSGVLVSITTPDGIVQSLTYDANLHLSQVISSLTGRGFNFAWTGNHITSVTQTPTAQGSAVWSYTYNGDTLTKVCSPKNSGTVCTTYGYTPVNGTPLLASISLGRGNTYAAVHYAADNTVDSVTNGVGKVWSYTNTTSAGIKTATVTDPLAHSSKYTFDVYGRLSSYTDGTNATKSFAYNDAGFLSHTTDANGNIIDLGTDQRGNIVRRTVVRGGQNLSSYFTYYQGLPGDLRNDKVIQARDARSASPTDNTYLATTSYNSLGQITSQTTPATSDFPAGRTTNYTYSTGSESAVDGGTIPPGILVSMKDPNNSVVSFAYDAKGDLRRRVDPSGLKTEMTYDQWGRKTSSVKWLNANTPLTTSYSYDEYNNLLSATLPTANDSQSNGARTVKTANTYDNNENLLTATTRDVEGHDAPETTTYTYDNADRILTFQNANGGTETKAYDDAGNLASDTSPGGTKLAYSYDSRNALKTTVLKNFVDDPTVPTAPRDVTLEQRSYDSAGRLSTDADAMGHTVQYQYNNDDTVAYVWQLSFHDPNGTTRNVAEDARTYDAAGELTQELAANGYRQTNYAYDPAGRLTSKTQGPGALNRTTTYGYNANDNVTRATTSQPGYNTEEIRYGYDSAGRVQTSTVENGATDLTTTYGYDARGLVTSVSDPRSASGSGYTTNYAYDELGRQTQVVSPSVSVNVYNSTPIVTSFATLTGYDSFGNAIAQQEPSGTQTSYTYNKLNQLTAQSTAVGTTCCGSAPVTQQWSYNADGAVTSHTNQRSQTQSYVVDLRNRIVKTTDPKLSSQTTAGYSKFAYDDLGNLTTSTNQLGAKKSFAYDDLSRAISATQAERTPTLNNYTTTYTYDDAGELTSTRDPLGKVTSHGYNRAGEIISGTDQLGKTTTVTRDAAGRPSLITDPLSRKSQYTYDVAGRETGLLQLAANGAIVTNEQYGYDAAGNQISDKSPNGWTSTTAYDALNRRTSLVEPTSATHSITTQFGYDFDSNQSFITDGNGNTTWTTYNALDLPSSVVEPSTPTFPNPVDRTWNFTYDAGGNLTKSVAPGGAVTRTHTYDELGRQTNETGTGAAGPATGRSINYDLTGNVTSIGAPNGLQSFARNDRGAILSQSGPEGSATFAYDADGNLTSKTDTAGTTAYTYTPRNQVATVNDPITGKTFTNSYDDASQLVNTTAGSTTRTYGYDSIGRLTSDQLVGTGTNNARSTSYGYDTNSNVTSENVTVAGSMQTNAYGYDQSNRLTSWNGNGTTTSYAYDDAGNRTQNGSVTATYNARNEMLTNGSTSYTYNARGMQNKATTGSSSIQLQFDSFDRIIGDPSDATMASSNGFQYDALDRLAARNGTMLSYDGTSQDIVGDGTYKYTRDPSGNVIAALQGTTKLALLTNAHQDVIGSYDPSASVTTNTTTYNPFGYKSAFTGTGVSLGYQSSWTNLASSTQRTWSESRWYSPDQGQWASRDSTNVPTTSGVTTNRYAYANDNPLTNNDQTGQLANPPTAATKALIGLDTEESVFCPECVALMLLLLTPTANALSQPPVESPAMKLLPYSTPEAAPTDSVDTPKPGARIKTQPKPPTGPGSKPPTAKAPTRPTATVTNNPPEVATALTPLNPYVNNPLVDVWQVDAGSGAANTNTAFQNTNAVDSSDCTQTQTCFNQSYQPQDVLPTDPSATAPLWRMYFPTEGEQCTSTGSQVGAGYLVGANDSFGCVGGQSLITGPGSSAQPYPNSTAKRPARYDQLPLFVETPHGLAIQETTSGALAARDAVLNGADLYKGGKVGESIEPARSQYFSLESPSSAEYSGKYGIPEKNLPFDWIANGQLRPGVAFVTRSAPPVGGNPGGGIEIVTLPGGFREIW